MSEGVTRRRVLAGLGVVGGVSAVGLTATATAASPRRAGGPRTFPPPPPGASSGARAGQLAADALTAGLTYRLMDMTAWNTVGDGDFRQISDNGVSVTPASGEPLATSVDPPIGSVLREVTVWYVPGADMAFLALFKKPLGGPVATGPSGDVVPIAFLNPLPTGDGTLQATFVLDETIDGTATYPLVFFPSTDTQQVAAIRYGYVAAPQAFIASTPIVRVLDTRINGGKLKPNQSRAIALGLPAIARAAVLNVTVTETEQTGFIAIFPDPVWPGNSSVNWSDSNQNIANVVITAFDADGMIRIHGAVNPTHVVVDVQGFML